MNPSQICTGTSTSQRLRVGILIASLLWACAISAQPIDECSENFTSDVDIEGQARVELVDGYYCFQGALVASERSTLITRDCMLQFDLASAASDEILWINDNATWIASDTVVGSNTKQSVVIRCTGNSNTSLERLNLTEQWQPPVFYIDGRATLHVSDSVVGNLFIQAKETNVHVQDTDIRGGVLLGIQSDETYMLDGLAPGFYDEWHCTDCGSVSIESSSVGFWGLLFPSTVEQLLVHNSIISHVEWDIRTDVKTLDGLLPQQYAEYRCDGFSLDNTTIESWTIQVSNPAHLEITNSDLRLILKPDATSVKVDQSAIWGLWCLGYAGQIEITASEIVDEMRFIDSQLDLTGTVRMSESASVATWHESTVRRRFVTTVYDADRAPMTGVGIMVFDPDGVFHTMAVTGENGTGELSIAFDDHTYNRGWRIEIPILGISTEIGFLSESILEFHPQDQI